MEAGSEGVGQRVEDVIKCINLPLEFGPDRAGRRVRGREGLIAESPLA